MILSLPASAALAGDWGGSEADTLDEVTLEELLGDAPAGPSAGTDKATPVRDHEVTGTGNRSTDSGAVTPQSADFELSKLSQPATRSLGESPFGSVTVTNVGSQSATTEVQYIIDIGGAPELDGLTTATEVTLDPGESTTVSEAVPLSFSDMNSLFFKSYEPGDNVLTGFRVGDLENGSVEGELAANISILTDIVTDWNEFDSVRDNLSGTYRLANNLNASTDGYNDAVGGVWEPIGNTSDPFNGTFDGNGSVISDLVVDTGADKAGLFGVSEGRLADVELRGADVTGTATVGALVGCNQGTVADSSVSGTVTGDGSSTEIVVGGIAGENGGTVEFSETTAAVTGNGDGVEVSAGGLVGRNNGTVESSEATGQVSGDGTSVEVSAGGLVGRNNGTVESSEATGQVSATAGNSLVSAGGVAGGSRGQIRASNATGDVTGSGTSVTAGGAVGRTTGSVRKTFATGDVSGTADVAVSTGGLAGTNGMDGGNSSITASYARGDVTASGDGFHNAGGFVGNNLGSVDGAFATGQVSGTDRTGLFVGDHDKQGAIAGSYAQLPPGPTTLPVVDGIENGTENASISNLTALPASQMTGPGTKTTMSGLDFGSTWQVPSASTVPDESFYPELQALPRDPDPIHVEPYRPVPTPGPLVSDPTFELPGPAGLPVDQPADSYEIHWYMNGVQFNTTNLTTGGAETSFAFGAPAAGNQQEITVEVRDNGGVVTELNRSFAAAPSILGTVTDNADNPVGDAELKVYDAADPVNVVPIRNATAASDGTYSVASTPVSLSGRVQLVFDPPNESALTAVSSDPFEPAGVDRVRVELGGPVEQLRDELEEIEAESRSLIDEHTRETAEVYVDGYQAFDKGGDLHKPRFQVSDTADLLDAVSETLKDSPSRKDIALSLAGFFKSLATGPSDHPLVDYHTERYSNAPQLRDEQLERVSELADAEWFNQTNYTDSPDRAYEQGFTETAIFEDAQNRLNKSSDRFDNLTEMNVSEIPAAFANNTDDIEYILERQLEELVGDQSYVITPNGSGVRFDESRFERLNYERAVKLAKESAGTGNTLGFIGLVASGATLLLLAVGTGGVALVALGLVSTVTGVGETLATVSKMSVIPRAVMHWKDSIAFWVADLEEIPRIHEDNVNWIADQIEDPTLHEVEGTIEGTTVRAQSYDDSSVDDPGRIEQLRPQPVLACHAGPQLGSKWSDRVHEVTVTNTGDTAATVHVVTELRRLEINGNEAVDISESVSDVTDPVTLAPGETRTIESSFTAYRNSGARSLLYNWLVASTVLMDGKVVGQRGNIVNIMERAEAEDIYTCRGDDSGVAGAVTDTTAPQSAFAEYRANTTVLAATDLTPGDAAIEQTVDVADDTEQITVSLGQQPRSNVTLEVVGPDGNVTGLTQTGGELASVEQIPGSSYSGPRDGIEGGESVTIESPPENLTVRAESRWFLSNGSFSTELRVTEIPERPALVDVATASRPGSQMPAETGETTETPVEIAEIGNQSAATVSLTVSERQLPGGINATLNQTTLSLAPGETDTVGLQIQTDTGVQPGVYPIQVNATGPGVETSALTVSAVTVDTAANLSVESLRRVTDGLQFELVGEAVGTPPAGYRVVRGYNITGNTTGEVDVFVENVQTDNRSVPFVRSNGEWESLTRMSDPEIFRRTVSADADALAVLEPVVDTPGLGAVADYANKSGIVTTFGLFDAIDDWRQDRIETQLLFDVVAAWRSDEPV